MKNLIVTKYGEAIRLTNTYPGSETPQMTEETVIDEHLIVHDLCQGFVDVLEISDTYKCLRCRHCGLRVVYPKSVKTYGDLKKYLDTERVRAMSKIFG